MGMGINSGSCAASAYGHRRAADKDITHNVGGTRLAESQYRLPRALDQFKGAVLSSKARDRREPRAFEDSAEIVQRRGVNVKGADLISFRRQPYGPYCRSDDRDKQWLPQRVTIYAKLPGIHRRWSNSSPVDGHAAK